MTYAHAVKPGSKVDLSDFNPDEDSGLDKERGRALLADLNTELDALQEELYAAGQHSVLVVLQGLDTSGKDGTIRRVFQNVDPLGCRVESFKVPTEEELAHDFLWRVHRVTPRRGQLTIFNRSHYEDVLVVRVHNLVAEEVWKARYAQINHFEELLAANNTLIFKFFLHISKDEQKQRLLAREQDVHKAWKLSAGDWKEREHWDAYQRAYEDALSACSTSVAPWYIVPADRKWHRDLAVAHTLVEALRPYRASWAAALEQMSQARLADLAAYRSSKT
jgi:PPK2 family polyphosphate:nucleotide phosphotransferase